MKKYVYGTLLIATVAVAGTIKTWSAGETLKSNDLNSNFAHIHNLMVGGHGARLVDADVSANAAIQASKISGLSELIGVPSVPNLGHGFRQIGGMTHSGSGSGFSNAWGAMLTPTESGSITGPNTDLDAQYTDYESAASANALAGWKETNVNVYLSHKPRIAFLFKYNAAGDLLVQRTWFAFTDTALDQTSGNNTYKYFGLRYDTSAGDTAWQCCSSDGTTASCTPAVPVTTPAASGTGAGHYVEIDMRVVGTGSAWMDGVQICEKTTNIPASNIRVKYNAIQTTLEATGKHIKFSGAYMEHN